ncbi:MAG: hypothetical protein ACKO0Z_28070 [Betaproteobacteria bacterium]
MAIERCCFAGVGAFKVREYGKPETKWINIGDVSAATENRDITTISNPNRTTPGGGNSCSITRYNAVTVDLELQCHKDFNLAIADGAEVTAGSVTPVVDEPHRAYKGSYIRLNKGIPVNSTIVVENTAGTTTYALGTDYVVSGSGIFIPESSSIADPVGPAFAANVNISYTPAPQSHSEAFLKTGVEYEVWFDAINEENNKRASITYLRAKFGPADAREWLSDGFQNLNVTAELLVDSNRIGAGLSGRAYHDYENAV